MTEDEGKQGAIHDAIVQALHDTDVLEDDALLTGWCLCFELQRPGNAASAGHVYGPEGMTTWRAIGLAHWAQMSLTNDDD